MHFATEFFIITSVFRSHFWIQRLRNWLILRSHMNCLSPVEGVYLAASETILMVSLVILETSFQVVHYSSYCLSSNSSIISTVIEQINGKYPHIFYQVS